MVLILACLALFWTLRDLIRKYLGWPGIGLRPADGWRELAWPEPGTGSG